MSNNLIHLRQAAENDLESIFLYSVEKFGSARAEQYIRDLERTLVAITMENASTKDCSYVTAGLYRCTCVSHIIFFKYTNSGIEVMRILHKSMDPEQHF